MKREKTIERTGKLRIHKNLVILVLQEYPEELEQIAPTWEGTAAELIAVLKRDRRQWIVCGELAQ